MSRRDDNFGEKLTDGLHKNVTTDFGPFLTMGIQLAAGVVGFFFIGYWIDGKLGTSPWCSLGGVTLGAAGGLIKFIRDANALGKHADEELRSTRLCPKGGGGEIEKHKREGR